LLKVEDKDAPGSNSSPWGNADALSVGEKVFAIAVRWGWNARVTEGILSTRTRRSGWAALFANHGADQSRQQRRAALST